MGGNEFGDWIALPFRTLGLVFCLHAQEKLNTSWNCYPSYTATTCNMNCILASQNASLLISNYIESDIFSLSFLEVVVGESQCGREKTHMHYIMRLEIGCDGFIAKSRLRRPSLADVFREAATVTTLLGENNHDVLGEDEPSTL